MDTIATIALYKFAFCLSCKLVKMLSETLQHSTVDSFSSVSHTTSCRTPYEHFTGNKTDINFSVCSARNTVQHATNFLAKVKCTETKNQNTLDGLSTEHEQHNKINVQAPVSAVVYESSSWPQRLAPRQRACEPEETNEFKDETHDEEPRVAGKVGVGNEQTPQDDKHDGVEHVANVTKP